MNKLLFFLYGLIAGAAVGILLAPESGRKTRGLIKDKSMKYSKDAADFTTGKAKVVAGKARGYARGAKEALAHRGDKEAKSYM